MNEIKKKTNKRQKYLNSTLHARVEFSCLFPKTFKFNSSDRESAKILQLVQYFLVEVSYHEIEFYLHALYHFCQFFSLHYITLHLTFLLQFLCQFRSSIIFAFILTFEQTIYYLVQSFHFNTTYCFFDFGLLKKLM